MVGGGYYLIWSNIQICKSNQFNIPSIWIEILKKTGRIQNPVPQNVTHRKLGIIVLLWGGGAKILQPVHPLCL